MITILLLAALALLSDDEAFALRVRACDHLTRVLPDGTVVVKWSCSGALAD